MYTSALRDLATNKFKLLESQNIFDILPHMQLDHTVYCSKTGTPSPQGKHIFTFDNDLVLVSGTVKPYRSSESAASTEEELYHYYDEFKSLTLDEYMCAIGHENIDGFDDHDNRWRQEVDCDYNCETCFDIDHVDLIYTVFEKKKTHLVRFQHARSVPTRTGMVSRGFLIVEPILDSVIWSDEQKEMMISIAKSQNWSLHYYLSAPEGFVDEDGTDNDYVDVVYKGLD